MARIKVRQPAIGFPRPTISGSGEVNSSDFEDTILHRMDFTNPDLNGQNIYNNFTKSGTTDTGEVHDGVANGSYTHLATGGFGGVPCCRLTQFAHRYQYYLSWTTPGFAVSWNPAVAGLNAIFYRWKIRIAPGSRWDSPSNGGKFIDHGSGANRNITWLSNPGSGPMALSSFSSCDSYGRATFQLATKTMPSWFGLPGSNEFGWVNSPNTGMYGSQAITNGIDNKGCWPGIITSTDHTTQPNCGPNSGACSAGGWIAGQSMSKLGSAPYTNVASPGTPTANATPYSQYAIWLQNTDFANPTGLQENWATASASQTMDGSSWNNGVVFGTYAGGGSGTFSENNFAFDIMAFEVGLAFHPNWSMS